MKKLLLILLFVWNVCEGQITIDATYAGPQAITTNVSGFNYLRPFEAGKLYLFLAGVTGASQFGTLSSTTQTWNLVQQIGNSTRRFEVYAMMPTSNITNETVTYTSFGGTSSGYFTGIIEISGVQTGNNGLNAIVQSATNSGAGADPEIALSPLSNSQRNAVIGYFYNGQNPFTASGVESGWTEIFNGGYATPDAGAYIMSRIGTTDNTVNVTASAGDWIGIALELRASGRRVTLIN